jgi:polar amino acid transport system substrate-binding protein
MKKAAVVVALVVVVAVVASALVYYYYFTPPARKVLRVGTSPDFPPFEFINETTNQIVGIDIDLVKAVARKLGYDVEIVSIDFEGLIPALQAGQIDLIASGMTITEERAKVVDFSVPYWKADQALLVVAGSSFRPKGLEDLVGKRVGVQTGTTAQFLVEDFMNRTGAKIDVKTYTSYTLATKDLEAGRLDVVIVDSPVASTLAKMYRVEVSSIVETGEQYGFAVKKGNTALLNALNQALNEVLKSSEWENIIRKYLG